MSPGEVGNMVFNKSLRQCLPMTTGMITEKTNVQANESQISKITIQVITASCMKKNERDVRERTMIISLLKKKLPESRTTSSVRDTVGMMTTKKDAPIILRTKARLRTPVIANSAQVGKCDSKSILLGYVCVFVDKTSNSLNAGRDAKENA